MTSQDRFMEKVEPDPNGGCWLWSGSLTAQGYGQWGNKEWGALAHRASWALFRGPIPEGLFVLHKCDVPACVNPDHLFVGTHADNMADMKAKGRCANKHHRGARVGDAYVPATRRPRRKGLAGPEFKAALAGLGMRTGEFSAWSFVDRRTVQRWAKSGAPAFVSILIAHLQCEKPS